MTASIRHHGTLPLCALLLAGCAAGPDYRAPAPADMGMPQAWHAQLPHQGDPQTLAQWWRQFDDPLLTTLIEAAERHHPTIASAVASVREARATLRGSLAGYFPSATAGGSMTRSSGGLGAAAVGQSYTQERAALDASWEIDLFGGTRRSVEGQSARLAASTWQWHGARVSLAAEVADAYTGRRQCEALVTLYAGELASRRETERLTALKVKTGFNAPADAAQAEASVAESQNVLENQKGLCARQLNRLVSLTGLDYQELENRLAQNTAQIPVPQSPAVPGLPASLLSQRPDVAAAERSLNAASADIGVAVADRLPSLTLAGSIGVNTTRIGSLSDSGHSWSFGPSLSLPIFDAGRRAAAVEAARARYDQALAGYRSTVIAAVQEVEDALVRVDTAARRAGAAERASQRYGEFFASVEQRYRYGAASLLTLEEARRLTLTSRESLAAVHLELSQSWIALYKAAGGGWQAPSPPAPLPQAGEGRLVSGITP